MQHTETILKWKVDKLTAKIDKLNRKAVKLGCEPIDLKIDNEHILEYWDTLDNGKEVKKVKVLVDVTLTYNIPIVDGWKLVCNFDAAPKEDTGELVIFTSKVPDEELPEAFLNKNEIHCDHCGHNRFRKKSYLMRNIDSGEYKEVGSTCVKDFFGHDPKGFLLYAAIDFEGVINDIEYDDHRDPCGYGYDGGIHLPTYLATASAVIREYGWVSKGKAWKVWQEEERHIESTASQIITEIYPPRPIPRNWKFVEVTEADMELAEACILYFKDIDPKDNDYLANCQKVADIGYVIRKMEGVAASMIPTYKRTLLTEEELKRKQERKVSNYIGEVGQRIENVKVECVYTLEVASDFGTSVLYILVDEDGNVYKTFYSGYKWSMVKGDKGTLKGTVKKHEEYKNEKNTMLTRVQITDIITPEGEHVES